MAVCPVCGCKTEEIDFAERKIVDTPCKVCSFCDRQLNVFSENAEPTEAQLRWLNAVISKEVPDRDVAVLRSLEAILSRFSKNQTQQTAKPRTKQPSFVPQGNSFNAVRNGSDSDAVIDELQKRVVALENEIRTMKRKQMIKTIIELGAPFVLLILFVIVFLSSGIIDNIKTIFDMAGITL